MGICVQAHRGGTCDWTTSDWMIDASHLKCTFMPAGASGGNQDMPRTKRGLTPIAVRLTSSPIHPFNLG